jgi:hypothetical protein
MKLGHSSRRLISVTCLPSVAVHPSLGGKPREPFDPGRYHRETRRGDEASRGPEVNEVSDNDVDEHLRSAMQQALHELAAKRRSPILG